MQILGPDRYNPEKLKELEADVLAQADAKTAYNSDVNFTVIRIYQFYPTYANASVVQKILLMVRTPCKNVARSPCGAPRYIIVAVFLGYEAARLLGEGGLERTCVSLSLHASLFTLSFSSHAVQNARPPPSPPSQRAVVFPSAHVTRSPPRT